MNSHFADLELVERIMEQNTGDATSRDNVLDNNNTQIIEVKK
jgi:hypothetical protein